MSEKNEKQAEREAFEAWAFEQGFCVVRGEDGSYATPSTDAMWGGWLAALAQQPQGEAWEYSFVHSSATGRPDETVGPCLTYDRSQAFGVGCINQRRVFVAALAQQPQGEPVAQLTDILQKMASAKLEDSLGPNHMALCLKQMANEALDLLTASNGGKDAENLAGSLAMDSAEKCFKCGHAAHSDSCVNVAPHAEPLNRPNVEALAERAMHEEAGYFTCAVISLAGYISALEAKIATPPAAPVAQGLPDEQRTKVRDAIAEALGDAYDCLRVWSAWGVGTMGPDDFAPVAEDDDRLSEITDAAIGALLAASPADQGDDARYPEGFDESCGIEARFMRAANAALCDMTGNRQWDVPCLATHIKSMSATPESQEGDA